MRICVAANGTRGDLFPFLAIGRELAARGHEVVVFTHPYFAADVAAAGLGLYPLAPEIDLEAILCDPDLFHHRRGQWLVFRWVRDSIVPGVVSFRQMLDEVSPDAMVGHYFLLGGMQLCREAGIPFVNVCLAPCAWLARDDPSPALQQRPGPVRTALSRSAMGVARPVASRLFDRFFAREFARAGLATPRGVVFESFRGGDLNLGMWSRHLRGPCADDPAAGVITGFAFYDGPPGSGLDPELADFLEQGEPPIVFAMGSAAHSSAAGFYAMAARACTTLGVRGVLLTGSGAVAPRDLPRGVRAFGYAPFGELFPRAAVTVQHGGIGSVGQALRAGRPTLVVPRAHDQFNNGVHVERLGVGRTRAWHRMSERRFVALLDELGSDAGLRERAGAVGERVRAEHGARVGADYAEVFCGGKRPSPEGDTPPPAPDGRLR